MRCAFIAGCLLSTLFVGCALPNFREDQDQIRCALLELYTDQIMDNLIRTCQGLPIVQLDYTDATSQVTVRYAGGVSDNLAVTHSRVLTAAAKQSLAVTRTVMNTLMLNGTNEHDNQVVVTASPVTTSPQAYEAYRQFLAIPGSLVCDVAPPPPDVVHIGKWSCGKYYWVPCSFRREFLALALATTAERAQPLAAPPRYYAVNIVEIVSEELVPNGKGAALMTVRIDQKIPNDTGRIDIGDSASMGSFALAEYTPNGPRIAQTDKLVVYFDPSKAAKGTGSAEALNSRLPVPARVFLRMHRPELPAVEPAIGRIEFELQQIQFNQTRMAP